MKWFKRNQGNQSPPDEAQQPNQPAEKSPGIFGRMRQGLSRTRQHFGDGVARLLLGKKEISPDLLDELEMLLVSSDIGMEASRQILHELSSSLKRQELRDGDAVYQSLQNKLVDMLGNDQPLDVSKAKPYVIMMVGINGAGKTTTIGKLAQLYQQQGKKVMLAAGDTFRAAAVEQLKVWGERNKIPVIAQHTGADSASVIFDALQAATARGYDVVLADTAGRLHTQGNLMEELKKIKRVMQKINPDAPHEIMLVLDGSIGQNALNQARQFNEAVGVTGITMTKLDGTARGGILFAIAEQLAIPFRYIGVGEGIEDLRPFKAQEFVKAIFSDDHIQSGD